jgi:Ring finger domain
MSDTCIVCLGDLGGGASSSPVAAASPRPEDGDGISTDNEAQPQSVDDEDDDAGQIAHLLPCGHNLHNNCLKPWVERANSCPICRQNFNVVELSDTPGGRSNPLL